MQPKDLKRVAQGFCSACEGTSFVIYILQNGGFTITCDDSNCNEPWQAPGREQGIDDRGKQAMVDEGYVPKHVVS